MNREWLTAREIAAEKLPGLPTTESAILRMAARESWDENPAYARNREGRGGGREYHFRILPTLAQIAFNQRHMVVAVVDAPQVSTPDLGSGPAVSDRAQRERDARLAIVFAFERFSKGLPLGLHSRLQIFTDKYSLGSILIDPWVKDIIPQVSKRSLMRWRADKKAGKANNLAYDPAASRKGTGTLDIANGGAVRDFILALIAHQPFLSAKHVRKQCGAKFGITLDVRGKPVTLPNERAFQRAIAALKSDSTISVALVKLTNPDFYRSTMAPAGVGTYRHITEPNQLWMIDASPVDVLCTDGRHSMYGCIDIATRRFVITVSKTPRASAVALMIRKAAMAWGVPDVIKTDNGSDFVARDTQRLFTYLNIEIDVSDAYTPQQKGHIERAIKTFQHDFAPQLPGFVGHSVADRKAIETRKSFAKRLGETEGEIFGVALTAAQLQVYIDRWLDVDYQHSAHGGLKGLTPAAKAAQSAVRPRMVDVRAFDVLLMPVAGKDGQRVTTKFGIRIDGYHFQTPGIVPGTQVFVRQDPLDAGRAYAFTPDGAEFLGMAENAELAGTNPAALQKLTRETHAAIIDSHMKAAKSEIRSLGKRPLIEASLEFSASQAPNVVPLPKRPEEHTTPQIAAALAAMGQPAKAQSKTAAALFQAQMLAERADAAAAQPSNIHPLRTHETDRQRFRRALEIERRIEAGEPVEERDLGWLQGYRTGSEYRSMRIIFDDFGEQATL